MSATADLYLDLLKRSLTRALQEDNDYVFGFNDWRTPPTPKRRAADLLARVAGRYDLEIVKRRPYVADYRDNGVDWPARAETMIGHKRLDNLQLAVETVLAENVPGDLVETGVWRGGATIFMRGVLKAHGDVSRTVWACDSFEGLPEPNARDYPADAQDVHHDFPALAVGVERVRHNFRRYNLLDDQVRFLVGWFSDTLPSAPIAKIAVLRLDGDMYESTIQALNPLYPKLEVGGFCIIDDYHLGNCKAAVDDYRRDHDIRDEIVRIDNASVFWRRSSS